MKKLLYIGNKLSKHGYNKTSIETLGLFLFYEGFEITYTSSKKNRVLRLLDMLLTTLYKVKKIDYVLIDVYSTSSFWYTFFCSQIIRIFKVKYICILRGGNLPVRLKKSPYLCQLVFNNAFKNVAPSNYLMHEFEKWGYTNITHIPNTIEIDKYKFTERTTFHPKLLWVRAFASIYNPLMAVSVLFELQKKYPEASLTMVGPDKDGSLELTKQKAKELGVTIEFTGQLSKEEWWQLSVSHDVFINTTHFDNTPVSVMEAMALGLPIVSTNVGGIPYLLTTNENAILVNDNDVHEMVKSIEFILSNPQSSIEIVKNARQYVARMDWGNIKENWATILC